MGYHLHQLNVRVKLSFGFAPNIEIYYDLRGSVARLMLINGTGGDLRK